MEMVKRSVLDRGLESGEIKKIEEVKQKEFFFKVAIKIFCMIL